MRKPISLTLLLFTAFAFHACIKQEAKSYTLSGTLYRDCSGVPLKGEYIELFEIMRGTGLSGPSGHKVVGSTTTDSAGRFTITYSNKDANYFRLRLRNNYDVLDFIEINPLKNIEGLKVYANATASVKVILNVRNTGSTRDTLLITDLQSRTNLRLIGPFTNGELYTVPAFNLLTPNFIDSGKSITFGYILNSQPPKTKDVVLKQCANNEVVIDVMN